MSITDSHILEEMAQVSKDLEAFKKAYDAITSRIVNLENNIERYNTFINWAGTQAALNVLVMCVVRCEGLLEDYNRNLHTSDAN